MNEKKRYTYAICTKCGADKKPTGNSWCVGCNAVYRKNKKEIPLTIIENLQQRIAQLEKEIALLKALPAPIQPVTNPEPPPIFEHPRLKILFDRMRTQHTRKQLDPDKLISLIEPIVKRNHYACFQELLQVLNIHDTLLNYDTGSIYNKYRDLCLLYKSVKNPA